MQYRKTAYAANEFETYWFEKNLQGDIVAVYSEDGTKLISYTYDAWGNFTTTYSNGGAATTATYNPFTYRGYYYDAELELYYLNSRYYDSNTGRFINVDAFISTGQGLVACNMYAYCLNNSVMRIDFGGFVSYTYMDADETDDEYEGLTAMGGGGGTGQIKVTITQYNTSGVGQKHHPISNRIANAASQNINLRGIITRTIGTIKAFSLKDHQGYQDWHRSFDNDIVNWIYTHPTATLNDFLDYLNGIYASDVATSRFGPVAFSEYKYFK